jgi:hypothetical protein
MVEATALKESGMKVTFSEFTSLMNIMKMYQLVQKILVLHTRQRNIQEMDLTSLTFLL